MKAIKQAAILYNGIVFKGDRHRNIIARQIKTKKKKLISEDLY